MTIRFIPCFLLITLLLLSGCGILDSIFDSDSQCPYFPMHVGDTWNYIRIAESDTQRKSIKILKKIKENGNEYYFMDQWIDIGGWYDSGFIRLRYDDENDRIMQYILTERREIVRYDFKNESWGIRSKWGTTVWNGKRNLEDKESPAGNFSDCISFLFNFLGEVYTLEYFAPNVGCISFDRFGWVSFVPWQLESAIIDGKKIPSGED